MTIAHHPGEDLLLDYAGGGMGEAVALAIATHLAFCAQCRRDVALAERIGGGLLEDLAPVAVADGALDATLARLDGAAPFERPRRAPSADRTPEPLRGYIGGDLSQVRWRQMGPRLSYRPLFKRDAARVKLLRGLPGSDVGNHTHRGMEYTVVLTGGFTDETGSYGPGDFQATDAAILHNPVADPGEDCVNLAVTTAPLNFVNPLRKIAAWLFGF